MTRKDKLLSLVWAAVAAALFLPNLLARGMFLDGLVYASISRNLVLGEGSLWFPFYTQSLYPVFSEHPPLFFWLEGVFFLVMGDHVFTERLFSIACFLAASFFLFRILKRATGQGWLGLMLFATVPVVHWAFQNNMLEMLLCVFIYAAFGVFQLRYDGQKRACQLPIATLLFVCTFLVKGPVALGTLALPFCFALGKTTFRQATKDAAVVVLWSVGLFALLFLVVPDALHALGLWWEQQIVAVFSGSRVAEYSDSRFELLLDLPQQLAVPALFVGLVKIVGRKKPWEFPWRNESVWATLLFSLPFLVTQKQHYYYIVPALGFGVCALLVWLRPNETAWLDGIARPLPKKITLAVSMAVVGLALFLTVRNAGTYVRHQELQADLGEAFTVVAPTDTLFLAPQLSENWGIYAYAMRNHRRSVAPFSEGAHYLLSDRPQEAIGMQRATQNTAQFHVWEKAP